MLLILSVLDTNNKTMSYRKTDESLDIMLANEGFQAYPSHSNKYWNPDGRVIWTDGSWYQDAVNPEWWNYSKEVEEQIKR